MTKPIELDQLASKLSLAKKATGEAEQDLERLLVDLRGAPRAEKSTITPVLEAAFTKLRAARADLQDIEKLLNDAKAP